MCAILQHPYFLSPNIIHSNAKEQNLSNDHGHPFLLAKWQAAQMNSCLLLEASKSQTLQWTPKKLSWHLWSVRWELSHAKSAITPEWLFPVLTNLSQESLLDFMPRTPFIHQILCGCQNNIQGLEKPHENCLMFMWKGSEEGSKELQPPWPLWVEVLGC